MALDYALAAMRNEKLGGNVIKYKKFYRENKRNFSNRNLNRFDKKR